MKPIRLVVLFAALVICALSLSAFAPAQTALPPGTATPVAVATPGPDAPGPFTGIVDQAVLFFLTLLAAAVGSLMLWTHSLKAQAVTYIRKITPDDWEWAARDAAYILVRAAYQQFPQSETTKMLKFVQESIYKTLETSGVFITPADKEKIRAIIDAACVSFYVEIGKPELIGF